MGQAVDAVHDRLDDVDDAVPDRQAVRAEIMMIMQG
jgi:hypothetical protein